MNTNEILANLRAESDRIGKAIAALLSLGGTGARRGRTAGRRSYKMSAAARARIAAAMRARWAAKKKGTRPQQEAASKKKGRGGITAAGRKRLSLMMKKRWAERRKQAKSA
jgi:hypothetical protein